MVKRKIKLLIIIVFIICLIIAIYSSYRIITWKHDVNKNKEIQKEIKDKIKVVEKEINDEDKKGEYDIDFKPLKEQNSDTVASIKVNGTNIDYIVVKGSDNSYYLNHNFNKEYNIAGWIFADYRNKFDETDKNIVIFGHNTKDGSMFGTLKNILNRDWYENNNNVTLITENGIYYYQVFSIYSIKPEDYYINTEFKNNDEFDKFIKTLKSRSIYDYKIEVSGEDKILTLSICIGDGTKRVVLHAKLIENGG